MFSHSLPTFDYFTVSTLETGLYRALLCHGGYCPSLLSGLFLQ